MAKKTAQQRRDDELQLRQAQLRAWYNETDVARKEMATDFLYADGKQWREADKQKLLAEGRPAATFNQLLPHVELISGLHRDADVGMMAMPRGTEDRRLSEVVNASLKAAWDFGKFERAAIRCADDAIICGLGALEVGYILDDAEDLWWGDIVAQRLHPLSFIYDPWATQPNRQDGAYMGKMEWMDIGVFRETYPKVEIAPQRISGWIANAPGLMAGDATEFGTPQELQGELYDEKAGKVRIVTLYHKRQQELAFIVDVETGEISEAKSRSDAEERIRSSAKILGSDAVATLSPIETDTEIIISDMATGQPLTDQRTQDVMRFADLRSADRHIAKLRDEAGQPVFDRLRPISRKVGVPHWTEMVGWRTLDEGKTSYDDRHYPFAMLVSRQFSDEPSSIQGIIRQNRDPQDEYNKRYSNILGHLNSSSHSGWLNPRGSGAKTAELRKLGSAPGVVIEYTKIPPTQIKPTELSRSHFDLLPAAKIDMQHRIGTNAEVQGITTQKTVSGRAIRARQEGGLTILRPRLDAFVDFKLDLYTLLLSRIQQFYPVAKIRRIIAVAEENSPLGAQGQPLFLDPVSGEPMPDDLVRRELARLKTLNFDLVLKAAPQEPTVRQSQFEQGIEMARLVTASGRPIGPSTMNALTDLADVPIALSSALKQDIQMEVQSLAEQQLAEQQGKILAGARNTQRAGNAGGDELSGQA